MQGNVPTVVYYVDSKRQHGSADDTLVVLGMTEDGVRFKNPPMSAVNKLYDLTGRGVVVSNDPCDFSGSGEQPSEPYRPPGSWVQFMQIHPHGKLSEGKNAQVDFRVKQPKNPVMRSYVFGEGSLRKD